MSIGQLPELAPSVIQVYLCVRQVELSPIIVPSFVLVSWLSLPSDLWQVLSTLQPLVFAACILYIHVWLASISLPGPSILECSTQNSQSPEISRKNNRLYNVTIILMEWSFSVLGKITTTLKCWFLIYIQFHASPSIDGNMITTEYVASSSNLI
jgi:hypothetical protein